MRFKAFVVGAALLCGVPAVASAAELVSNGGFEMGHTLGAGEYAYPGMIVSGGTGYNSVYESAGGGIGGIGGKVGNWTYYGSALVNSASAWYGSGTPFSGLGSTYAALQSTGVLYQLLTVTSDATKLYASWYDAGRSAVGTYDGNQTYSVGLAKLTGADASNPLDYTYVNSWSFSTLTDSLAALKNFSVDVGSAGQYLLVFAGTGSGDHTAFIDGVSVQAVPGPVAGAGLPALVLGVGALMAARRRKAA